MCVLALAVSCAAALVVFMFSCEKARGGDLSFIACVRGATCVCRVLRALLPLTCACAGPGELRALAPLCGGRCGLQSCCRATERTE